MNINTADIQKLRQETGVGMMEAKKALVEAAGDVTAAVEMLRKAGKKIAAAKSSRAVKDGTIGCYVHADAHVAALVALACETDFVARTDDFKNLARDLAVHVAAMNPPYLAPEDIPSEVLAKEEEIYREQMKAEGKPEAVQEKIMAGKMEKFYAEKCLLKQPYVRDDKQTVGQLIEQAVAKMGENIRITGFSRLAI